MIPSQKSTRRVGIPDRMSSTSEHTREYQSNQKAGNTAKEAFFQYFNVEAILVIETFSGVPVNGCVQDFFKILKALSPGLFKPCCSQSIFDHRFFTSRGPSAGCLIWFGGAA